MTFGAHQWGSAFLRACAKTTPWALFLALALAGCSMERHTISSPGTSQAIRVESGDRLFMDLEENRTTGYQWTATCNDPDVEVTIEHEAPDPEDGLVGKPGTADVTIRVHRGYDGPSTVTFCYKRPWEAEPIKTFTITLFKRTGDTAFWE